MNTSNLGGFLAHTHTHTSDPLNRPSSSVSGRGGFQTRSPLKNHILATFLLALTFVLIHIPDADARPIPFNRAKSADGRFSFTASPDEHKTALARGYAQESACESCQSPLFYIYDAKLPGSVPALLFHHAGTNAFIYSSNTSEIKNLIQQGWASIRVEGYVFPSRQPGSAEIFHLYNAATGNNLYTTSPQERDYYLVTHVADGWAAMASLGFTQPESSTGVGVLKRGVITLDEATLAILQTPTTDGKLVFGGSSPLLDNLRPGKLLYAEVSPRAPTGVLARVEAIQRRGFDTVLTVSPGRLTDIFEQLHLFVDKKRVIFDPAVPGAVEPLGNDCPPEEKGCSASPDRSVTCAVITTAPDGGLPPSNSAPLMEYMAHSPIVAPEKVISAYAGLQCTYTYGVYAGKATVDLQGSETVGATISLESSFGHFFAVDNYFTMVQTPSTVTSVTAVVSGETSYTRKFSLYKIKGGIPFYAGAVALVADLELSAGFGGKIKGEVTLGAEARGSFTTGVYYNSQDKASADYHDKKWHVAYPSCGDGCLSFAPVATGIVEMEAKAFAKADISVGVGLLWYAAELGGQMTLEAYLKGKGKATLIPPPPSFNAQLLAGADVGIQGKATGLWGLSSHVYPDKPQSIWKYETVVWEKTVGGPTAPSISDTPAEAIVKEATIIKVTAGTDPAGKNVIVDCGTGVKRVVPNGTVIDWSLIWNSIGKKTLTCLSESPNTKLKSDKAKRFVDVVKTLTVAEGTTRVTSKNVTVTVTDSNSVQDDFFDLYINGVRIGAVNNPPGGSTTLKATLKSGSNKMELRLTSKQCCSTYLTMHVEPNVTPGWSKGFYGTTSHGWTVIAP